MLQRVRSGRVKWALAVALAVMSISCGRSENVGWANREQPVSVSVETAQPAAAVPAAAAPAEPAQSAVAYEYQQLVQSLSAVQIEAMSEAALSERWTQLIADVDAAILARSSFHRNLLVRRDEIDSLVARSQQPAAGDSLTREQRMELARHYRNIQVEMARVRNGELHKPEFRDRYMAFQIEMFARMRELAPERRPEIDRMEQLESERFLAMDTMPEVPSMLPPGVQPGG